MANLYDKAGLVNIPVGYQDGFLYNIKPEDNTLGFRFNRDSSATRVNKEGLIEQVGYFGPELVQNGNFSELGSELMPSVGVIENLAGGTITQISGNSYGSTSDGTSSSTLRPKFDFNTTSGKTYKLVITPIGTITGTVNFDFYDGTTYLFQNYDFTTTKEIYFTDNGSVFGAFDGTQTYSISNFTISVKQVDPNDYWNLGNGWVIENGAATCTELNNNLTQDVGVSAGKSYKVTLDVIEYTSGTLALDIGGSSNQTTSSVGSKTFYFQTSSTGHLRFYGGSFRGSIDNVSVVEVLGDKPRIDYTDSLTSPSFLLEPQSTNLLLNSNNFLNWTKEATVTLTPNYGISPDGVKNSTRMQMDINDSIYISTTSGKTFSVYVKGLKGQTIRLANGGALTHTLTGEWDRISLYDSSNSSSLATINTYSSATARDVEIFGAQIEALSYPTSYIPTSGSTVTRTQETCLGAGSASTFNSAEGVLYAEISAKEDSLNKFISLSDGTDDNRVTIYLYSTSDNEISCQVRNNNSEQFSRITSGANVSDFNKVAISFKENLCKFFVNGLQVGSTDTLATIPSGLNTLEFGKGDGADNFYGKVKSVYVFNEALTNDELQQLTT